jgi:tRNA nucleotidyltransferase (CCA-adding enzyme)
MIAMVIRRTTYPQAELRAADLVTAPAAVVPRTLALGAAARLLRRRRAGLVVARVGRGWATVTPKVLERALELGLAGAPLDAVLWDAPGVGPRAPETAVRRAFGAATPVLVVVDGATPIGGILREPGAPGPLSRSAAAALARLEPPVRRLLDEAGRLGESLGWPVAVVGGVPRDLLGGRPGGGVRDLDVVVEGDGRAFARRLAERTGGAVREHPAFGTATVRQPGGERVDVATARREHYARPGALPAVEPATLAEDLMRRDFSVNALAVRLDGAARGRVVDPAGGLADLARRRVRVLHPLSFVEDPTRIFRAGRFATRLGFRLDPTTGRLLRAAARLDVYGALSADRLRAERDAVLAEPAPAAVLAWLGRAGAFRLVLPGYRAAATGAARLGRVEGCARDLALDPDARALLYLLALGAHLPAGDLEAWLARWAVPPRQRGMAARAREDAPALLREPGRGPDGGAAGDEPLPGAPAPALTAAWACVVAARPAVRRRIVDERRRLGTLPPLLTGDDLRALGLSPGPLFGRLLAGVRRGQSRGRLRSREEALGWVQEELRRPIDANRPDPHRKGG